MAELVRVSRDGSTIIAKVRGAYVTATNNERTNTAESLAAITAGGSWRRPINSDAEKFADALTLAEGGVVASSAKIVEADRSFRVPPTVKRSISQALEAYSSLLSDADREVALRLATHTSVSRADIEWMHRFYANIEKAFALHGGKRGQAWSAKMLSDADEALAASAFEANPNFVYFAGGDDPNSTEVDTLYAVEFDDEGEAWDEDSLFVWRDGDFVYVGEADSLDRPQLIELDVESAQALADYIDKNGGLGHPEDGAPVQPAVETPVKVAPFELQNINPLERNLFELAESEIDWEHIDRLSSIIADATGYSPAERSQNAQRQPRQTGGRFGGAPEPMGDTLQVIIKARLPEGLAPVEDINALLDEYLAGSSSSAAREDDEPVVAAGLPEDAPEPLYLAVVDPVDQTAVLDALAIVPGETGEAAAYVRRDGEWTASPETIEDLRGVTPPTVVKLDNVDIIKQVLAQIDEHDGEPLVEDDETSAPITDDAIAAAAYEFLAAKTREGRERAAKKGYALPDGSFPISNVSDLQNAIQAFGRAKNKPAAKRHIKKRARALNRYDLIPDTWSATELEELFDTSHLSPMYGPHGELVASVVAAGIPGVADTPSDKASVERLYQYWTRGEGAAKIRWGTEGDLTRCHRNLAKYVGPERAWGLCQNYHQRIFGVSNAKRDKAVGD